MVFLLNKTVFEIQSGYTGINDIKEHKVREAHHISQNENIESYVVHFDLFNGSMAIIHITNINGNSIHWKRIAQIEGQKASSIPKETFKWSIMDKPVDFANILYENEIPH